MLFNNKNPLKRIRITTEYSDLAFEFWSCPERDTVLCIFQARTKADVRRSRFISDKKKMHSYRNVYDTKFKVTEIEHGNKNKKTEPTTIYTISGLNIVLHF